MGWSLGFSEFWKRDIGYGVPAKCDHPDCKVKIDRGFSYFCGSIDGIPQWILIDETDIKKLDEIMGCGLFFCVDHKKDFEICECQKHIVCEGEECPNVEETFNVSKTLSICLRCQNDLPPFEPSHDIKEWINFKLTDLSWKTWKDDQDKAVLKELIQYVRSTEDEGLIDDPNGCCIQ